MLQPILLLYNFSADGSVFYRIAVLDRSKEKEILAFAQANEDGTLDELRDRVLEKYYVANRGKDSSLYQNESLEWKPFQEVKGQVADQYFAKVLLALEAVAAQASGGDDGKFGTNLKFKDRSSALRFFPHLNKIKQAMEKDPASASHWIASKAKEEGPSSELSERSSLAGQWKIEKSEAAISRENPSKNVDTQEAFALAPDTWSSIKASPDGDLAFYQVKNESVTPLSFSELSKQTREIQEMLGAEAQRHLMRQVIAELKSKHALSLDYLNMPPDGNSGEAASEMEPF